MTEQERPEPSEEDKLRDQAREDIKTPPEPIPDAADLPDDVPSEPIDEEDEAPAVAPGQLELDPEA